MPDDVKQVKVDNWGVYFLQRLKHFFNRTDYCDLTLQFQDNAQLKVHRLVLSACTEYFELLERTCEMYEDCLVMPDDLQADVVVPIVNFMYTGQLEFKMDLLESLYQTSQIMNMPVLTKLLDAHRQQAAKPQVNYSALKRSYCKASDARHKYTTSTPSSSTSNVSSKRSHNKAFGSPIISSFKEKKIEKRQPPSMPEIVPPEAMIPFAVPKKSIMTEPRPTRYELPEELCTDNIFDDSFTNISYTSQPLMVHPETTKHYPSKLSRIFTEASSSKSFSRATTVDIVECKKITRNDNLFDDEESIAPADDIFDTSHLDIKPTKKMTNQLFDQILDQDEGPKVTIETKDSKQASNIDHAKIISEVLKKYPHLVKSNKNIKLKILDVPNKSNNSSQSKKCQGKRPRNSNSLFTHVKTEQEPDFTYETDVLNSQEAARLIAMGAENTKGPWICLICGAPGKALNFTSYYKFRRHLVEVHNEKPISKICEYCGLKSLKRNYLLHHMYTKHGVEPPPPYRFPKCNLCNYVALSEGFLVKHKSSHIELRSFRCNVCATCYNSSAQLLAHIQNTGHKYSADRKANLQCIYCLKIFLREPNLYAHIKTNHKELAISDGIIEESEEEEIPDKKTFIKYETPLFTEDDDSNSQYQIQERPDGNIQLIPKKHMLTSTPTKQKILNTGFNTTVTKPEVKQKIPSRVPNTSQEYVHNQKYISHKDQNEEIVVIDNNEYIVKQNTLIPKRPTISNEDYIINDMIPQHNEPLDPPESMEYSEIHTAIPEQSIQEQKMVIKKSNMNHPIQIVVSNEEEYKALMNSNHSIIFDEGDANKTLTVLSASHAATMDTATIDLDNTHPNDMMIIQDNYPLSVSETIPGDNSNIVVVYSHPVDDENKQYQIITSQDIGAQFVQTSAVITPTYESATTSAPIMTAQVMEQQVPAPWHTNNLIQNNQPEIPSAELQNVTLVQRSIPIESNDRLDELPEVTLTSKVHENSHQHQQIDDGFVQTNNVNEEIGNESSEQQINEEIHNESVSMDVDTHEEVIQNEHIENSEVIQNADESVLATEIQTNASSVTVQQIINNTSVVEEGIEDNTDNNIEAHESDSSIIQRQPDDSSINSQNHVVTEEIQLNRENATNEEPSTNVPEMPQTNLEPPKIVKEQINTLASEWSEDEEEAAAREEELRSKDIHKAVEANNSTKNAHLPEMEESIENIQQEMVKQMAGLPETEPASNTEDNTPPDQDGNNRPPETTIASTPPPAKISSLLNDWDDNDSHEGNESSAVDETTEESKEETHFSVTTVTEKLQQNDDKIKSLVSDWDDEDEEKS